MRSSIAVFIVLILSSLFFTCKKNNSVSSKDAPDLFGTWVKGANPGDTLWFMRKNGKDILRMPESFNSLMPAYAEKEYQLHGEALKIKSFSTSQEYFSITSFKWTDPGKEFTILNNQLYMFLSSMITYKYRKI